MKIDIFNTTNKYNIIYADPGWEFDNKHTGGSMSSGSAQQYTVSSVTDICNLPVKNIAADDCVLFMWWVASMPKEAIQVAEAWGFKIKTMTAFTWLKQTVTGKDHFGMGFWTRQQAENVLIAIKGKPQRISRSIRQLIRGPVGIHSQKPAETRDRIVKLMGDLPRIELFAREHAPGWDCWGDQC